MRPTLTRAVLATALVLFAATSTSQLCGAVDPAHLGKGTWIYSLTDATNRLGGHAASVTNEPSLMLFLKHHGIRFLVVKAGTGSQLFNECHNFPQFSSNLVQAAHQQALLIFGYNRSYATNTAAEVAIADFVFQQGADGFVWDAEAEWESTAIGAQGPALAWAQCSTVRSHWPNKFLAHAPFPIITLHSSFPYKEFGYWCDSVMPQIYHHDWLGVYGSPSGGINWSDANWVNWQNSLSSLPPTNIDNLTVYWTNAIKPLAPVVNVYGAAGQSACGGVAPALPDKDVLEFLDYLSADPNSPTAGGYHGVSFWRAELHGPIQWANIDAGTCASLDDNSKIVLDNAAASTVGNWTFVRTFSDGCFYGNGSGLDTNSFGTTYLVKQKGLGTAYVQFTPAVTVSGDYDLYHWHPFLTNASAHVPFVVNCEGGPKTMFANQQTNAGNWSWLGKCRFSAGTTPSIRITDEIPEPDRVVMVDGLKMVLLPPKQEVH